MRTASCPSPPYHRFHYSNLGMAVLGRALGSALNGANDTLAYEKAIRDRITDADDNFLAITNEEGAPVRVVPLFTAAGGLSAPVKKLTFKASSGRDIVYKDTFTKANGDRLSATNATQLFEF